MDNLIDTLNKHRIEKKTLKMTVPRELAIQKRKFLCAIGKGEHYPTNAREEKFVKNCFAVKKTPTDSKPFHSLHWTDAIANNSVKQILSENQNFDFKLYVCCAKVIFLTYSGVIKPTNMVYEALTYVLTHARSFDDPSKNVFQLQTRGSFTIRFLDAHKSLPDCFYMTKIKMLIEQLNLKYDNTKYQILNVNVTYLTLLILKRFVGSANQFSESFKRAHEEYLKLCPNPLSGELPKISELFNNNIQAKLLKPAAILAIHAYLSGNDVKTKKVLQSCVQYMEWTGLQLPRLFFKVVRLYGISETKLWDALCGLGNTHRSLYNLSKDYYLQYEKTTAEVPATAEWFPFCRALDGTFHVDLSAQQNLDTCMILAYLVDLKIGFDNSFVRNAHWAKKIEKNEKGILLKETKKIFEQYPFA